MNVLGAYQHPGYLRYEDTHMTMLDDHTFKFIIDVKDTDGVNEILVERSTKVIDINALDKYKDDYIKYSVYAIRTRVTPDYRDGLAK